MTANNLPSKDAFLIVELKEDVPKELPSRIVCIYSTWIQNDKVKYKGPPYDKDGLETIDSFLQTKSDPPESWPWYSCEVLEETGKMI